MEKDLIAYCGVDCSVCQDYLDGKCPSCRETEWTKDDMCMPVKCCRAKDIDFCAGCGEFPCTDMKDFYDETERHWEAFLRMEDMRRRQSGN